MVSSVHILEFETLHAYGREKDRIEVPVTIRLAMWNDEIVEETRQVRDRYAVKFDYDLDAIYSDLKKQQEQDPKKFISLPPKQSEIIPQQASWR
jgi:hypothetical protein